MFPETKLAVQRAFEIGKVLFSLNPLKYNKLIQLTKKIPIPTKDDIKNFQHADMTTEQAIECWFKQKYSQVAINIGLEERHGLAALAYAAILKEIKWK